MAMRLPTTPSLLPIHIHSQLEMQRPVAPRLDAVEHVLVVAALHAAHDQPRQVAVQVLFFLGGLLRGGGGCGGLTEGGRAGGGAAVFDGAAWGEFDGCCGGGFGAARCGEFEVEGFDFGFGVGEGGGQVGELGLEDCGLGGGGGEVLLEEGGLFGGFFLGG